MTPNRVVIFDPNILIRTGDVIQAKVKRCTFHSYYFHMI